MPELPDIAPEASAAGTKLGGSGIAFVDGEEVRPVPFVCAVWFRAGGAGDAQGQRSVAFSIPRCRASESLRSLLDSRGSEGIRLLTSLHEHSSRRSESVWKPKPRRISARQAEARATVTRGSVLA